jgi:hypothetical protein
VEESREGGAGEAEGVQQQARGDEVAHGETGAHVAGRRSLRGLNVAASSAERDGTPPETGGSVRLASLQAQSPRSAGVRTLGGSRAEVDTAVLRAMIEDSQRKAAADRLVAEQRRAHRDHG